MLARSFSGAVYGVDAYIVEIEVNAGHGDPRTLIVGLPDAAVRESKDRVSTAIINSGFLIHRGTTTVNLAPADMKKEGPCFDLPIAIGMIAASGDLEQEALSHYGLVGELALSGEVRRVRGVLPLALEMKRRGLKGLLVPAENVEEAAVVAGLDVHPVANLREAVDFLAGKHEIPPQRTDLDQLFSTYAGEDEDYRDVKGQEHAKRAIEVAVAGGHNILAIGSPGTGKTMLARRVSSILPVMSLHESLETTKIHSIAGTLGNHQALIANRPFRAPHHTISDAGLLGGGTHPVPGEVSLAHHGVLFLDELPEFHRNVLEVLRQPLEDKRVTIARSAATVTFPCEFMLVAAMNPCPCGYYGDLQRECRCSPKQIHKYRNKISGPLLDRIDIHVEVPSVGYQKLTCEARGEPSQVIRERVVQARAVQQERFARLSRVHCNASMRAPEVQKYCRPDPDGANMLRMAVNELNFSARAYDRILKVARTIADLAGSQTMKGEHVAEAIQYRTLDREMW